MSPTAAFPILIVLSAALVATPFAGAQTPAEKRAANLAEIERSKALIEEYYELQRQIDAADARAENEKQILNNRVELLQIEIDDLTGKTSKQTDEITKADEDRGKLVEEHDGLEAALGRQLDAVEAVERRVRSLLPALPKPLADKLKDLTDRMPEPGKERGEIEAGAGTRFAAALAVLDQISRFDSDTTVVPETRKLADGREVEVQTLYLGLAGAFYAGSGASADIAGTGVPTAVGWQWTERPEEAETISRAIRQYSREEPAEFVGLPVELRSLSDPR